MPPASVSVLPSAEAVNVSLNIGFPSFFQVTPKALVPSFATAHVHPEGQIGPVAGWSLPSKRASQVPFSSTNITVTAAGPLAVILTVPGEPIFTFFVFHFPARPDVPDRRV